MTMGAVGAALLIDRGLSMAQLFALCGLLTFPVVVYASWRLRRVLLRRLLRFLLTLLYRVEVSGLEHAQAALPKAVIAANHTSFLDGLLLGAFLPGEPIFAIDTQIAKKWWVRPLTLLVNALPVDPTNPLSIRSMIRAVEAGAACVIFPEGRITTTGALMKVYEGPAVIAERTGAALVPVRIEGAEYSPFSRLGGKVRRRWFPKIRIKVLPAERIAAPEGVVGRKRRVALRTRSRRRDGPLVVRDRRHRHHAARRAARGASRARRRARHRRRPRVLAADLQPARRRQPGAGHAPRGAHGARRARRRAPADVTRLAGHLLRAAVPPPRAGDAQLLDRRGVGRSGLHGRGDPPDRHRASLRREGQARAAGRGARRQGDDPLPRGRQARDRHRSASSPRWCEPAC